METKTKHHNKDLTVRFDSGRELRVPKHIVAALTKVRGVGEVERIYLRDCADFLVGGRHDDKFEMETAWASEWEKRGMAGNFKPFVDGDEFFELFSFLNDRFGRDIPFPSGISHRIGRVNIRALLPFIRFRQSRGAARLWEVDVNTVLGDGKPNERIRGL